MKVSIPIIVLGSIIIAAMLLPGCVTLSPAERARVAELKFTGDICGLLPPITYDGRLDTPDTKAQIKKYNAKIKAFCATNSKGDK